MSPGLRLFVRTIALPQDHGAWVFLLSPLLIGLFAGGRIAPASCFLVVGALAAFLARQPVTTAVRVFSGRRPRTDLPAAAFWTIIYGLAASAALAGILIHGFAFVLFLAAPGLPVFAWHLYLVSKRAERKQAGVEIVATGVLALAAPAGLWVGTGSYAPIGWALWLLAWLQSAASIVHAYLRLGQRGLSEHPTRGRQWEMGRRAFLYTSFNLSLAATAGLAGILPKLIALPFMLQWLETLWGITHPAIGVKATQIGIRQLLVSSLFTLVFILVWRE